MDEYARVLQIVIMLIMILFPTMLLIWGALKGLAAAIRGGADVAAAGADLALAVRQLFDSVRDPLIVAIAHATGETRAEIRRKALGMIDPIIALLQSKDTPTE